MANINNLERQHKEIGQAIKEIKSFVSKNTIEEDAGEIAKLISLLAGKLKIHLQSEDKFLYPNLLQSNHIEIKTMAKAYIDDMGMISMDFTKYKDQFNTKYKISNDVEGFKKETLKIFTVLEIRLSKEDKQLYPLIKSQK